MLEKDIEKKVCKYAKDNGFLVYKFTSPGQWAVPDRVFISPNKSVFFIEFKAPGKKPTPAQMREITRIRDKGILVFVVDDVTDGKRIIDTRDTPAKNGHTVYVTPK